MLYSKFNFLQSPVISLCKNIFLRALFSNTLSLRSSLNARGQVLHPYKTAATAVILYVLIFTFPCCIMQDKDCEPTAVGISRIKSYLSSSWLHRTVLPVLKDINITGIIANVRKIWHETQAILDPIIALSNFLSSPTDAGATAPLLGLLTVTATSAACITAPYKTNYLQIPKPREVFW